MDTACQYMKSRWFCDICKTFSNGLGPTQCPQCPPMSKSSYYFMDVPRVPELVSDFDLINHVDHTITIYICINPTWVSILIKLTIRKRQAAVPPWQFIKWSGSRDRCLLPHSTSGSPNGKASIVYQASEKVKCWNLNTIPSLPLYCHIMPSQCKRAVNG